MSFAVKTTMPLVISQILVVSICLSNFGNFAGFILGNQEISVPTLPLEVRVILVVVGVVYLLPELTVGAPTAAEIECPGKLERRFVSPVQPLQYLTKRHILIITANPNVVNGKVSTYQNAQGQ